MKILVIVLGIIIVIMSILLFVLEPAPKNSEVFNTEQVTETNV